MMMDVGAVGHTGAGRPKKRIKIEKELSLQDKLFAREQAFYERLAFKADIDLDEWSDLYRILPQEASSEHGPWSTQRFPFLRRIMKCLSPSSIADEIVACKGCQLGFTEVSINWELYKACCWPGPSLYAQKTDDATKEFVNLRFKPSVKVCDEVYAILGEGKPKHYAKSWDHHAYPGGAILFGGATDVFLRSKPVKSGTLDEEDTFDLSVGKQGSPARLLGKRMVNFPDHKMYRVSTPVLKELSTIEPAWEAGSQERYYVPCPHCNPEVDPDGHMFWLKWEQIKWSKKCDPHTGLPLDVWLECPRCAGKIIEEQHKTWMLNNGDWYSEKGNKEGEPRYKVGDVKKPSFHISSLYSPVGFFSWRDAVGEWFEYERTGDVNLLQVFINQTLGESFTLEGHELSYGYLEQRKESYAGNLGDFEVPLDAVCLTAGADVQDDRIEVEVVGWGMYEENWSIEYKVFTGDTGLMGNNQGLLADGQPSVWKLFDEYLLKKFKHASGAAMPIEVTMIDAGHKTAEVHTFCRLREHRRVFPIKGDDGWGKGMWSVKRTRHQIYHTIPYTAYVDELKSKVYSMLKIDVPGPGYCHFPNSPVYSKAYFKGLTCESRQVKYVNGFKKLYWEKPSGARNEPIDCRNYALVARLTYPANIKQRLKKGLLSMFPRYTDVSGVVKMRKPKIRRRGSPGL